MQEAGATVSLDQKLHIVEMCVQVFIDEQPFKYPLHDVQYKGHVELVFALVVEIIGWGRS